MKRPSDQLKLFLFGFLRTASALATTSHSRLGSSGTFATAISASSQQYYGPPSNDVTLTLRIARPRDVSDIAACNLACLPENYNHAFYSHHMRQWPDLTLVAVIDDGDRDHRKPPHMTYHPTTSCSENKVVAYVLGKVEEHTEISVPSMKDVESFRYPQYTTVYSGHVTSLAVLEQYRRLGLAAELMKQLHHHFEKQNNLCRYCGLHVRTSNSAAVNLYEKFGYTKTQTIPTYYQDGEDAYYMTRPLSPSTRDIEHDNSPSGFLGAIMFRRRNKYDSNFLSKYSNKPWEHDPDYLRLPRSIGFQASMTEENQLDATSQEHQQQATPELMTGTI